MIRTVEITGFKSIADLTIDLGRLNCLIGANGAGKSNLLEAIGILSAAANGRVDDDAIRRRGVRVGLPRMYKTSFKDHQTPPHISMSATSSTGVQFAVSLLNPLEDPQRAWSFKTESLTRGEESFVSRGVKSEALHLASDAGLTALKMVEFPPETPQRRLVDTLSDYAIFSANTPALRSIVPDIQMRAPIGLSGGGLALALQSMLEGDERHNYTEWLEVVSSELLDWVKDIAVLRDVESIVSPSMPHVLPLLGFTDRFMKDDRNTLTAYDASEGALYVLFAGILCVALDSPAFFAIDNLDQALNPRLMTRLVAQMPWWLEAANPERQLIFTAHNPALLDGLNLDDDQVRLFAVDRNSLGHTTIRRIVLNESMRSMNKQFPLSRLWMDGALGAVPNV